MAAFAGKEEPKSHIANTEVKHRCLKEWSEDINNTMIPAITTRIIAILTPSEDEI